MRGNGRVGLRRGGMLWTAVEVEERLGCCEAWYLGRQMEAGAAREPRTEGTGCLRIAAGCVW